MTSMTSIAEQAEQRRADRARLQELLTALDAGEAQLRRDECGDWQIAGTRGHVYAMGSTFHLVVFVSWWPSASCDVLSISMIVIFGVVQFLEINRITNRHAWFDSYWHGFADE
jgi:hypothetical protein